MSDEANAGGRRWGWGWLRTPRCWTGVWTIAGCVAIALGLAGPMFVTCGAGGCRASLLHLGSTDDWRHFAMLWEAARVALRDFHQFPSWNPYHCGGLVLYQHPESPFPGPLFLLTFFWLPTAVAMKVWIVAHLVCGTLGARALVADRGGNAAEQLLGAALMAASGFFAEHIGGGHLSFTPFLYLPLILWAFRRALRDVRYAVVVAGLFAVTVLEGGTYPAPLMAVALAIECLARLGSAEDRRGMARAVPVIAVLFVLLAGVRLLPALHYLAEHPRLEPLDDGIGLGEVFSFWTTHDHARRMATHRYVWPEYDTYVGAVPVALMLVGVLVALFAPDPRRRERRIDLAVFAALVWCALGRVRPLSLAALLHALPVFRALRVPSRFLGPAMVGFGLLAATALAAGRAFAEGRGPRLALAARAIALVLVLGIALDICLTNQRVMQQGLEPVLPGGPASADFFQNSAADYSRLAGYPVAGFGTRGCYVALEWKPAPGIADGHVPQARLEPPSAGTIVEKRWSPNRLDFDIQLDAPATVIINQNYETGWHVNGGEKIGAYVVPERRFWDIRARPSDLPAKGAIGLLAVPLAPGTHHLALWHRPPWLWPGALLSFVGIALAGAVLLRARRAAVAVNGAGRSGNAG
ncbi:MAG TPA: hypothetical protein VI456_07085 [Polyangia bacterium]